MRGRRMARRRKRKRAIRGWGMVEEAGGESSAHRNVTHVLSSYVCSTTAIASKISRSSSLRHVRCGAAAI
jgi:hypothetical protein